MSEIFKVTENPSVNSHDRNQILNREDFYEKANSLIAKLHAASGDDSHDMGSEAALMQLAEFGASLVQSPAISLAHLKLKTMVYRALAPEAPASLGDLSIDEQLLQSIIADIGQLS